MFQFEYCRQPYLLLFNYIDSEKKYSCTCAQTQERERERETFSVTQSIPKMVDTYAQNKVVGESWTNQLTNSTSIIFCRICIHELADFLFYKIAVTDEHKKKQTASSKINISL